MTDPDHQPLLSPYTMSGLQLPNRVVMAPLTRMRAANPDLIPTTVQAEHYAQRASAGLIISEGIFVSPESVGWADVPGLWSEPQIRGWQHVTDAVHTAGGRIVAQLWHTGALGHPSFGSGVPLSASAVNPEQTSVTPHGRQSTVTPRPMSRDDIRETVAQFARAARNAIHAGFDGVQIQGGFLYLFNQFLSTRLNLRTDEYGGSVENRARFLFEVIEAVVNAIGSQQVGIKVGPSTTETGAFASNDDTLPTSDYVIARLNEYDLSHLLLMGPMADLSQTPLASLAGDGMFLHYRALYHGTLMANAGLANSEFTAERANRLIQDGVVDLVAYGRRFIANPDLPARLAAGAPLADADPRTFYGATAEGYTDYPVWEPSTGALLATASNSS